MHQRRRQGRPHRDADLPPRQLRGRRSAARVGTIGLAFQARAGSYFPAPGDALLTSKVGLTIVRPSTERLLGNRLGEGTSKRDPARGLALSPASARGGVCLGHGSVARGDQEE